MELKCSLPDVVEIDEHYLMMKTPGATFLVRYAKKYPATEKILCRVCFLESNTAENALDVYYEDFKIHHIKNYTLYQKKMCKEMVRQ